MASGEIAFRNGTTVKILSFPINLIYFICVLGRLSKALPVLKILLGDVISLRLVQGFE